MDHFREILVLWCFSGGKIMPRKHKNTETHEIFFGLAF